jgi:hypothetical protein
VFPHTLYRKGRNWGIPSSAFKKDSLEKLNFSIKKFKNFNRLGKA